MCIIDRKTYQYPDGSRQTVETTSRCNRAVGNSLCKHVQSREAKGAQYVATRPSHDRSTSDGAIVTEAKDGRQRVYRDLSNRSSNSTSSSIHRSNTMSQRSSISVPSSASSASYSEPKTAGPSPLPLGSTMSSPLERTRQPYPSPPRPPAANMIVTPDGTAQYSRPPSLSMERATEIERPSTSAGERSLPRKDSSFGSMKAEVDDAEEVMPSKPKRRPTLKVKTEVRPSRSSSSPSVESPGLSSLPGISHFRKDSGKAALRPESSKGKQARFRSDSVHEKRKDRDSERKDDKSRRREKEDDRLRKDAEQRRLKKEEDERQARLERGRIAESDVRQSARDKLYNEAAALRESLKTRTSEDTPSDASRERNRQAAYSALERDPEDYDDDDDDFQQFLEAEEAQMARERDAAARRRESANNMPAYFDDRIRRETADDFPPTYVNDQLRRDADARAQYEARRSDRRPERRSSKRISDRPAPRGRANTYTNTNTAPVSTRSPVSTRALPVVHQYGQDRPLPSARHSGTIPQRGAEVIAQAQARGSRGSGNMADAFGNMTISGGTGEQVEPSPPQYYYDAQGRKRFY